MKKLLLFLAVILAGSSLALGQATTMPVVQAPIKVLVIPFTPIGDTGGHEWVGAAIEENLQTDAAADPTVQATALDRPLSKNDLSVAMEAAKGTGATLVVFGAYQYANDELRVTGRVVDVNYGRVLETLKATGATIDLFKVEDALSSQFRAILPQPPSSLPVVTYGSDQSAASGNSPATAAEQPQQTYIYYQTPQMDTEPGYSYSYPAYDYPYYDYGVPFYYYGGGLGWGYGRPWSGRGYHGYVGGGFRGGFNGGGFHGAVGGFHGGFGGFHGGGGGHHR